MRVIGHRGAASLAPENSIRSIEAAVKAGVDAIEFDIRLSKDGKLYLCHDPTLERTHDINEHIANLTAKQLSRIKGADGDHVPTLNEALKACGQTQVIIEAKSTDWAKALTKALAKHPNRALLTVISLSHHELAVFRNLCPDIPVYVIEHNNPFDAINAARLYNFDGIDINHWTLNPLAYHLAKRHNIKIITYTVDKPWVAKLIRKLYPEVDITTNRPQDLQFLRVAKPKKRR